MQGRGYSGRVYGVCCFDMKSSVPQKQASGSPRDQKPKLCIRWRLAGQLTKAQRPLRERSRRARMTEAMRKSGTS